MDAIANDNAYEAKGKSKIDLGVDVLPVFPKDNTDRNRTSPFAFTGNRFEFRMPGSAMNLADANTVLNTAVAYVLRGFAEEMEGQENFTAAAAAWVKKTIKAHQRILFNGNGYSTEWEVEAKRRGLYNMKTTVDALPMLVADKNIRLMDEMNVLSPVELQSRCEVELEHYSKIINIEALTALGMARRQLIPAALKFMGDVAETAAKKRAVSDKISIQTEEQILTSVSKDTDDMNAACDKLDALMAKVDSIEGTYELAVYYGKTIVPAMEELRAAADHCEIIVGKEYWPLPSYAEMLFYV